MGVTITTFSSRPVLASLLLASACADPAAGDELEQTEVATPLAQAAAEASRPERRRTFASAAFLHRVDAEITPWCSAVLVAPDVAVTAIGCVPSLGAVHLRVGLSSPGSGPLYEVDTVKVLTADPRLAALRLRTPVEEVEPATLGGPATRRRCDAYGVSWLYVLDGDPSRRWLWSACVEPADLGGLARVEDGEPNCHGDYGAGVYSAEDELLGIVVSVAETEECAVGFQLVTPLEQPDAFDEALALGG